MPYLIHYHAQVVAAIQVASLGLPATAVVAGDAPGLVFLACRQNEGKGWGIRQLGWKMGS